LILSCGVLISILLLVAGSMTVGVARLATTDTASFHVFQDATANSPPQYTDGPISPIVGFESVRPTLPLRVHQTHETSQVGGKTGGDNQGTFTATVGSQAAVIGPLWTYTAYPVGQADQQITGNWFQTYSDEARAPFYSSLGLAPAWTP